MGKQYQTSAAEASTLGLTIPAEVSVALAEIAHSATEGLLALAVGAGLQVLGTLMEESVVALAISVILSSAFFKTFSSAVRRKHRTWVPSARRTVKTKYVNFVTLASSPEGRA
jgi:hypothetical protein